MSDSAGIFNVTGPGTGGLLVYLDNTRLGGIAALSDVPTSAIESIQFLDPATAAVLFPGMGSNFINGAIVVHSRKGR